MCRLLTIINKALKKQYNIYSVIIHKFLMSSNGYFNQFNYQILNPTTLRVISKSKQAC